MGLHIDPFGENKKPKEEELQNKQQINETINDTNINQSNIPKKQLDLMDIDDLFKLADNM